MILKKRNINPYFYQNQSNFKRGIDLQREIYKRANIMTDFDVMVASIENLKSEIKSKAIRRGHDKNIKKIERILSWYKNLERIYAQKTPDGIATVYPDDIGEKISKFLNIADERECRRIFVSCMWEPS